MAVLRGRVSSIQAQRFHWHPGSAAELHGVASTGVQPAMEGPHGSLLALGRRQEEAGVHPDRHRRGMEAGDRRNSLVWRGITLSLTSDYLRHSERRMEEIPRLWATGGL